MKAAICTSFDVSIPFERAAAMIAQAGFEVVCLDGNRQHADYGTAAGRAALGHIIRQNGLDIDSVHAPFPEGDRLFSLDDAERAESLRQCRTAVDAAAELDGKIVVIHLIQPYDIPHGAMRDQMIGKGRQCVEELAGYAAERGVKLAFENGQKPDYDQVLANFMDDFTAEHIGFCYDSGHENVQGNCFQILERFGRRLFTVHLHDNQGWDAHMLPYEGTIDWERFREVIHDLPYRGNLLLEVQVEHSQFKDQTEFLAQARQRVERLLLRPPESQP